MNRSSSPEVGLVQQSGGKWSRATLSVFSTSLSVEDITRRLDLQPTSTHAKGEPRGFRRADGSVDPTNAWSESAWHLISPLGREANLEEHIKWVLYAIEPRSTSMNTLRTECRVRLFCGFASHGGQGGFALQPETLARISKLGLSLELDLYPPSDPEVAETKPKEQPRTIQ